MPKLIMALDSGTTSNRCILFDHKCAVSSMAQKEFTQYYPKPGWIEHDPMEIWESQTAVAREAMQNGRAAAADIAAIGITNQRETTVVWEAETGKPIYNAIVWQCRRTAEFCDEQKKQGRADMIRAKTGLVLDAYFSGTKIRWILENVPGARERAEAGELRFGTIETWLIWNLTGGKVHVTDYSNASRTMLYNINTLEWDEEILDLLEIPRSMLPEVKSSSEIYGYTVPELFGGPIPISGAAGDQQSALFGQACFWPGTAKNTYGTGAFMLMNTGRTPVFSDHGLITTIAWGINGHIEYALEGSVFIAGAAIQWLRDELQILESAGDSERLAREVEDTNGCYIVPAFTGLGAPYWNAHARGTIVGLTRGVNRKHLIRATLESLAFQVNDLMNAMQADSKIKLEVLNVDGGASANSLLLQMQADISNVLVQRPACIETTAMGAAYLAGLAAGFWTSIEDVALNRGRDQLFMPQIEESAREEKLSLWANAVKCAALWETAVKKSSKNDSDQEEQ